MQCNQAGVDLIKSFEGCELTAYADQGGVWTIGYGTTGPFVTPGLTITQEQADNWLTAKIQSVAASLSRMITLPLNENEFSALCSWAYNVGIGSVANSTLLKELNEGDVDEVPNQLMLWNHVDGVINQGLVRRRAAEVDLWNLPVDAPVLAASDGQDMETA